jgi:AraC-like DNA-binding protein
LPLVKIRHIRFNMPRMLYEPTTLASLTGLLATSLQQEYDIDPAPIFFRAGIPVMPKGSPQQRYPLSTVRDLWEFSKEASGDEAIGLKTGGYARPPLFYAFGYSWMASSTLLGALQRLMRYYQLMSTASVVVNLTELEDSYALSADFPEESKCPPKEGIDCGMTALLALCDIVAEKEIRPINVKLTCAATVHPQAYRDALRAPIEFNAPVGTFYFSKETLLEPLPHGTPDVAKATDKIAEQYIETLDPHKVASQVRRLLISLLSSGKADQELVSKRLNRSASTLQRQLSEEGLTYREVLESTRRSLAEDYLTDGKHSQAQIAFMLGFSDQSNFSRAFKRWTHVSPKQFQDSQAQ